MKRCVLLFVFVFFLFLFAGCASYSQYVLTSEYVNPQTGQVEQIGIPVSQYQYEQTSVGEDYTVKIRTAILGVRVPITNQTMMSSIALLDTLPIALLFFACGFLLYSIYGFAQKRSGFFGIVFSVAILGAVLLVNSTASPEFTVTSTIIDKTFRIVSGGM